MTDYQRIEKAITFITNNFRGQPSLDEVAQQVHLSPFHFQKLFKKWAGVSPKKFLQFISVEHSKNLLKEKISLSEVSHNLGLSGTSRLHDLFVNIEGMTPGEFKNGGEKLIINFSFSETPFGKVIIASTIKGICHLMFIENNKEGFEALVANFPNAKFISQTDNHQTNALKIFPEIDRDKQKNDGCERLEKIKIHLKGTAFQLKVWQALLQIPKGAVSNYSTVAELINNKNASRAVGTAIGKNPIAYLIPCHRVIQSTGMFGGYRWGSPRKTAILGWEMVQAGAAEKV